LQFQVFVVLILSLPLQHARHWVGGLALRGVGPPVERAKF